MDFKDEIKLFSERVEKLKDQINTEEATKNAFIMPFIKVLGYDVFNPFEVVPEFVADIGIKKGEKVDYAIMKDGQPAILVECKHWGDSLDPHNSQLSAPGGRCRRGRRRRQRDPRRPCSPRCVQ